MTIAFSLLTSGGDLVDRTDYVSASIAPAANKLILAWSFSQRGGTVDPPTEPTCAGAGLTWTAAASVVPATQARVTVFRASSSSPGSGALTFSGGEVQANGRWVVVQMDAVDLAQGDQGVLQAATAQAASGTAVSVTLSAFQSATNATLAGAIVQGSGPPSLTEEEGFTEVSNGSTGQLVGAVEFLPSANTTPAYTRGSSGGWGIVGLEIAEAGAGPPPPTTRRHVIGGGVGGGRGNVIG